MTHAESQTVAGELCLWSHRKTETFHSHIFWHLCKVQSCWYQSCVMLNTLILVCAAHQMRILPALPYYGSQANFTSHWVWLGAAEMRCCGAQTATDDRYSASPSPVLPLQPEGRPGPAVLPGSIPAWLRAGMLGAACHTAGRLWSTDRGMM